MTMTREEAIEWLEVMKENAIFEQYDALKMAIEALTAQGNTNRANAIVECLQYLYEVSKGDDTE